MTTRPAFNALAQALCAEGLVVFAMFASIIAIVQGMIP